MATFAAALAASATLLDELVEEELIEGNGSPLLQSLHFDHPNTFLKRTREKEVGSAPYADNAVDSALLNFNTGLSPVSVVFVFFSFSSSSCIFTTLLLEELVDAH